MAEEGLDYVAKISDMMSGPAKEITAALKGLTMALEGVAKGEAHVAESSHKMAGAHHESADFLEKVTHHMRHEFLPHAILTAGAAGAVAFAFVHMAEAAKEAVERLGELAVEGVKFAIEVAEFKENATDAYEAVLGTAEEGERTFAEIDKLARTVHMPAERAHELAQRLMFQGVENQSQITAAVGAVAALQRTGLAAGAEKLERIIENSYAQGKFVLPKKLAGTGIQVQQVYDEIGKRLGVGSKVIEEQMKHGKVAAEVGVAAVLQVFQESKIAEVAAKKFTLTDFATEMKNSFRSMLQDVDVSPLMNALQDFLYVFTDGTNSTGDLKLAMTDLFDTIIRWIAIGVERFTFLFLHIEIWALEAEIAFAPLIRGLMALERGVEDFMVKAQQSGFLGAFKNLGKDVVSGITQGIVAETSGGPIAAITSVMANVVAAGRKAMGIHSPSAVMAEMGLNVTEGFAQGMYEGAPQTEEAMAAVTAPPVIAPQASAAPAPVINLHVELGDIHGVTGAHEIMPIIESQAADLFERLALELAS